DSPNQYIGSKDGDVYDGSSRLESYDFSDLKLQDSTYLEGLINLHKKDMALGTNDYYSYELPDFTLEQEFKPLTVHVYMNEADVIPDVDFQTINSLTRVHTTSELEPTPKSVLADDYPYYAYIQFINPSGHLVDEFSTRIIRNYNNDSGYFTLDSDTMIKIFDASGPGITSMKIQIEGSEYYKKSNIVSVPIEIKPPNWLKFGEKSTKIDLIDPFITSYGQAFDNNGDTFMPFESNYPHLMGTIWIEPDFMGPVDEEEQSIQDYIEINLMAEVVDEFGDVNSFPLRESVMLRPGNREGIMKFDIGLGPEDAFLMGLASKINLSFDISYNAYDIFEDNRDVAIYLLDLRLEENPSSSTPNTIWSIYGNQFDTTNLGFTITKRDVTIDDTKTGTLSLGGTQDGEDYGIEVELSYDPDISTYSIANDSELYTLLALDEITPWKILNETGDTVADWTQPYSSSNNLKEQSIIEFGNNPNIDDYTTFKIIYKFDFNFGLKNYAQITLGRGNGLNLSWIEFDLPSGFLPRSEDSYSPMFVRYNQTIIGDGTNTYILDYGIQSAGTAPWNESLFIIYNSSRPIASKDIYNNKPRITFIEDIDPDNQVRVVYGVRSQYELGYGFQKVGKSYSDSVRLIYNNDNAEPIISGSPLGTYDAQDPALYIGLDNSSSETLLELYNIPLLFAPEVNFTFVLDPIVMDQISNFGGTNINTLTIDLYYIVSGGYGSYYTDSIEIPLDYFEMEPDLESNNYFIHYSKDLQGIYETFGAGSMDIYISISQTGESLNYIPYIILEQFDYMCDDHLVEMYSRMPINSDGDLDVDAVISTPHWISIFTRPFVQDQYGPTPFNLIDGSEVTVALQDLPYSSLVSLEGVNHDYTLNYLGTRETLPIDSDNFFMIPNLAIFTDAYDTEEVIYQDGFVNLYYGSGTNVRGEHQYNKRFDMVYESTAYDDYESEIDTEGQPTSWQDLFNITDQFLTTDKIDVSGTVLYHQLFNLDSDALDYDELSSILGNITGAFFAVQIPDEISIAQIRAAGAPYEYDLSVQGFPIGDYIDGAYRKVPVSGITRDFDPRLDSELMDFTEDYSLEFADNGSKYIVFYIPISTAQIYAQNSLMMVDYWAYHTFTEGFDYEIVEDPLNPYESKIDWDFKIIPPDLYTMHPDFSIGTSFSVSFSALDWSEAKGEYIKDGSDEFIFRPEMQTNISQYYNGLDTDTAAFSILNTIPDDQFDDPDIFKYIYVDIWYNEEEATIETYRLEDPITNGYIIPDVDSNFSFTIDFAKIRNDVGADPDYINYQLIQETYISIELHYISEQYKYPLTHTPFNYDYYDREATPHLPYNITLKIEGKPPIYSYDTSEFDEYILKIEDNYIYFNEIAFAEQGYIANKSQITVSYKFKLQPGLIDQEHIFMVIYPWTNIFETIDSDLLGFDSPPIARISGSSIISPFEYSLSINDTYSLYLSYRLNQRKYYIQELEIDYNTVIRELTYLSEDEANYITEADEPSFKVFYYDYNDEIAYLDDSHYTIDVSTHKIIIHNDGNIIATPNEFSQFYVSFLTKAYDKTFNEHTFTFVPWSLDKSVIDTLNVKYWDVLGKSDRLDNRLDILPNFNSYYYLDDEETTIDEAVSRATELVAYLQPDTILSYNLAEDVLDYDQRYDQQLLTDIRAGDYLSLHMNVLINNIGALEKIIVRLYDSSSEITALAQSISVDEIIAGNFDIKITLPSYTDNDLQRIELEPVFRSDNLYSLDNTIGVPRIETLVWNETFLFTDNNTGNIFLNHTLYYEFFIESTSPELVYMFNENLEYLDLPEGVDFNWSSTVYLFNETMYDLFIPNTYIDPNTKESSTFTSGDLIMIRYFSPVDKGITANIRDIYYQKKPLHYDSLPSIAECLLVNSTDPTQFTQPYNINISLPLTPFISDYTGLYSQIVIDINLSAYEQYAIDEYIDLSHILFSVNNPAYIFTVDEVAIIEKATYPSGYGRGLYNRIWQYTEQEQFIASPDPI
ncbi:hypothetical protein LCGC14_1168150, partial [marine sediment metagenome]